MQAQIAPTSVPPPTSWMQRFFRSDGFYAGVLGGPAFLGITLFLIVPFIFAFLLSFTNQRLLSPNPTEFVGVRNYDRLLSVNLLTLAPIVDETTGQVQLDEAGNPTFPRSRSITRTDPAYEGFQEWFSVDAFGQRYVILAKDPSFYRSFLNTFLFAVLVLPLQLSLALLMALLVNQKIPGVNIFRTIYFSPVVTSMVVISIVWVYLYNKDVGLMNGIVSALSFGKLGPFDWLGSEQSAMVAIVIMSAWQGMGLQMVIFLAGLQGIPGELYEAAGIDGANVWQKFRNVTIPSLRNTFVFIIIATTIAAFALFTQVNVMTSGGPNDATTTVMFHIIQAGFTNQDIAYGSAMSVVYFVVILIIALIQRRALNQKEAK